MYYNPKSRGGLLIRIALILDPANEGLRKKDPDRVTRRIPKEGSYKGWAATFGSFRESKGLQER